MCKIISANQTKTTIIGVYLLPEKTLVPQFNNYLTNLLTSNNRNKDVVVL